MTSYLLGLATLPGIFGLVILVVRIIDVVEPHARKYAGFVRGIRPEFPQRRVLVWTADRGRYTGTSTLVLRPWRSCRTAFVCRWFGGRS